jgi:hypothetical protein
MNTPSFRTAIAVVLAAAFSTGIAAGAMAETQWDKDHPRRVEVNHRLNDQDKRIHHDVKDGQMSRAEAAKLHRDDHGIRQEERRMASRDGSHLTKRDDRILNHQENQVSRQISQ